MAILRVKANSGWRDIPALVGPTPNIQIGTVETLEAGREATASVGGTAENPLLNLGIPRGADGVGGASQWITVIDTVLEEEAVITTGSMPEASEVYFVFAVPVHTEAIALTASSSLFGKSLPNLFVSDTTYGTVGFAYGVKINNYAIAFAGSGKTTSTNPDVYTTPRTGINATYYRAEVATDIPLKLSSALPVGSIVKVFVR